MSLWHAGMRLPGLCVIEAPSSVLGAGAFDVYSALPLLRASHRQSVRQNVNRNAGLIL